MGQLVFQATLGGQVNLVGPNTASTFNLNVPAVAGNLITSGDSATVTNTMLAGSIANAKLSNSSVTIGGTAIALGASSSTITNDLSISGLTVGKGGGAVSTNTAVGASAMAGANTGTGANNAFGANSLQSNTSGVENNAIGYYALNANISGANNEAMGSGALQVNTTGSSNTAIGHTALKSNTTASNNTAVGYQALYKCTTGSPNTAVGHNCLSNVVTGINNAAVGKDALSSSTGDGNTALGYSAGAGISTGQYCTAIGLVSANSLTFTGNYNASIGYNANPSAAGSTGQFTLGDGNISTLRCNTTSISSLSDARDKTEIVDSPYGLDFLLTVKPRQFKWASRDGNVKDGQTNLGFIAQELLEAANGKNDVVDFVLEENPDKLEAKYGNLLPIAIKAIQELKTIVDAQAAKIAELKAKVGI